MLYKHKTLELKHMTYDMRKEQQILYQRLLPDIMILSNEEAHPYTYARILDLFHVRVKNSGLNSILNPEEEAELPAVWVRWFKPEESQGFHALRYPSVSFYKEGDPDAFGFVHPDDILRGVHLIPHFKFGHTTEYLSGPSKGRPEPEKQDWTHYNINM